MEETQEIWKDIPEFEGTYQVSNIGNIRRISKSSDYHNVKVGTNLVCGNRRGYKSITLGHTGKRKTFQVHRLVAQTFIPNPNNYSYVNHINEIKDDNRVENLEWCDANYNTNYGTCLKRRSETRIKNNTGKPVLAYTCDGIYLAEFANVDRCSYLLNLNRHNLIIHLKSGISYHNIVFKYKE